MTTKVTPDSGGEKVTLRHVRPKALLKKERGVWVYQGESVAASVTDPVGREREKRIRWILRWIQASVTRISGPSSGRPA